jgi:hypothetical protein
MMLYTNEHWLQDDWDNFKGTLKTLLKSSEATVCFTKKDGTERVMRCTLNPDFLPLPKVDESKVATKPERKKSDTSLAVYDLDAQSWRSFVITSIKNVKA